MVRLHTSFLAVALATCSALASSKEFQRRELSDQVQSHGPLSFRLGRAVADFQPRGFVDTFDDLEARNLTPDQAKMLGNAVTSLRPSTSRLLKHRGLEDDEYLLVRDLDAEELFGREYDVLDERDNTVGNIAASVASQFKPRALEDYENLLVRDLDENFLGGGRHL